MTKWRGVYVKYAYATVDAETQLEAEKKLANIDESEIIPSRFFEDWVLNTYGEANEGLTNE